MTEKKKRKPRTWLRWMTLSTKSPLHRNGDDGTVHFSRRTAEGYKYDDEAVIRVRITEVLPQRKRP